MSLAPLLTVIFSNLLHCLLLDICLLYIMGLFLFIFISHHNSMPSSKIISNLKNHRLKNMKNHECRRSTIVTPQNVTRKSTPSCTLYKLCSLC